jgi:hypothetical protein
MNTSCKTVSTTILFGVEENQPTKLVPAKCLGNREEDTSEVLGQTGEYFDCGGFLPAASGLYWRQHETD